MKLSRMAQDSILFEICKTQEEIDRLKEKEKTEGLSEYEAQTLEIKRRKLRGLWRM